MNIEERLAAELAKPIKSYFKGGWFRTHNRQKTMPSEDRQADRPCDRLSGITVVHMDQVMKNSKRNYQNAMKAEAKRLGGKSITSYAAKGGEYRCSMQSETRLQRIRGF